MKGWRLLLFGLSPATPQEVEGTNMRILSLSLLVLCLIADAAFGWNGKRDVLRIALGMSPAEVQKVNGSCRPLDQVKKSQKLWSDKN